jgi:hypothetical protein
MRTIKTLGGIFNSTNPPWYAKDDPFSEEFLQREPLLVRHHDRSNQLIGEYEIDEQGFRRAGPMSSHTWFMGCSYTFGEAMPREQIFPELVAASLGDGYYNFGTPGASMELVARLLFKLREHLPSKRVIVLLPPMSRYETLVDGTFYNLVPNQPNYVEHLPDRNMSNHLRYRIMKAAMLMRSVCDGNDCHFFHGHTGTPMENGQEDGYRSQLASSGMPASLMTDRAADGMHYGQQSHRAIADFMLSRIAK